MHGPAPASMVKQSCYISHFQHAASKPHRPHGLGKAAEPQEVWQKLLTCVRASLGPTNSACSPSSLRPKTCGCWGTSSSSTPPQHNATQHLPSALPNCGHPQPLSSMINLIERFQGPVPSSLACRISRRQAFCLKKAEASTEPTPTYIPHCGRNPGNHTRQLGCLVLIICRTPTIPARSTKARSRSTTSCPDAPHAGQTKPTQSRTNVVKCIKPGCSWPRTSCRSACVRAGGHGGSGRRACTARSTPVQGQGGRWTMSYFWQPCLASGNLAAAAAAHTNAYAPLRLEHS